MDRQTELFVLSTIVAENNTYVLKDELLSAADELFTRKDKRLYSDN